MGLVANPDHRPEPGDSHPSGQVIAGNLSSQAGLTHSTQADYHNHCRTLLQTLDYLRISLVSFDKLAVGRSR